MGMSPTKMRILICFLLVKYGDVYGFEDSFGHLGKILWFLRRFSKQQNYVAFRFFLQKHHHSGAKPAAGAWMVNVVC